jgi:hypothetical protein
MPKKWEDYLMMDEDEVPLEDLPVVEAKQRKGTTDANKTQSSHFANFQ